MSRPGHSADGRDEQLIGALVPDVRARRAVAPAPLPALPPAPALDTGDVLLDMARIDHSGRFSARGLLAALGWSPGQRLRMDAAGGAVVIRTADTGPALVGPRGLIALPGPLRQLCGLTTGDSLVLIASAAPARLVAHPAGPIARILADYTSRLLDGDRHGC